MSEGKDGCVVVTLWYCIWWPHDRKGRFRAKCDDGETDLRVSVGRPIAVGQRSPTDNLKISVRRSLKPQTYCCLKSDKFHENAHSWPSPFRGRTSKDAPTCRRRRRNPNRVIKGKIDAYLYDSMETFEEDVRAMLGQQHMPDTTTTATATDAGGASKATKPDGVSSSSEEAATEETVGGDGDTARKRKEKLTAEFVARVARDRVMVERGIRAGLPALYRRP